MSDALTLTITLHRDDWQRLLSAAYAKAAELDANGLHSRGVVASATAQRLGDAIAAAKQVDRTLRAVEAVRDGAS